MFTDVFEKNYSTLCAKFGGDADGGICNVIEERRNSMTETQLCMPEYVDEQMEAVAEQFNTGKLNRIIVFFGISDGEIIRRIIKHLDSSCNVIIVEPDWNIFYNAMLQYDYSDIIEKDNVGIFIEGINYSWLGKALVGLVDYTNYMNIQLVGLPGYQEYTGVYSEVEDYIHRACNVQTINRDTEFVLAEFSRKNVFSNMPDVINGHSVLQLIDYIKKMDKEGVPAIIAAGGPSLDKNVDRLKKAKGRSFIIAVDTAMKTLLRHGIKPDLIVSIDCRKQARFFEHEDFKDIPLVLETDSPVYVIDAHPYDNFFMCSENEVTNFYAKELTGRELGYINQGGSVAHSAFTIAISMGFKTIILIGQDLAYTDEKMHTECAYDDAKLNLEHAAIKHDETYVEDIYGKMVRSNTSMVHFKNWFENMIGIYPDIRVIDATEGGALIKGTSIATLDDAILTECVNEFNDYDIGEIPPLFNEEQRKMIFSELRNIDEILENFKAELRVGINAYNRLMNAIAVNDSEEINKSMNIVKAYNNLGDKHPFMSLISKYMIGSKYEVRDQLYGSRDDSVENTIRGAQKLLQSYIDGIDCMKEDVHLLKDRLN